MLGHSAPDGRRRRAWLWTFAALAGCYGSVAGDARSPGADVDPGGAAAGGNHHPGSGGPAGNTGGAMMMPPPVMPPGTPATGALVPAGMRRLTVAEYRNTIRDLIGPAINVPVSGLDRDDPSATFGSVGGYGIPTSPSGVVKYADTAYSIADQVFADPKMVRAVLGCDPQQGAACAATFLQSFGRRAWRRPLTDLELQRYTRVVTDVTAIYGDPARGFHHALAALLQSVNFVYLPELGESDAGKLRFTSYEMAARLSYLLTDTLPDAELSAAADRNELVTPEGLGAQVARLLGAAATRPSLTGFFAELLELGELDGMTKDATIYPQGSDALFRTMGDEARRLIAETTLVRRNALFDLLDDKTAYVNPELAKLYGLPAPTTTGLAATPWPAASERGGILTTAAWLSIQAHPYSSSPTYRGVWIRKKLLCEDVSPPPPGVDNVFPNPSDQMGPPQTTRQILEQHRKMATCAACHSFFDTIGVAFERFDGIGAARTQDQGLPIDTSGTLDDADFQTLPQLIALLKKDTRTGDCMVRQLFRFVSGHQGLPGEDGVVSGARPALASKPDFLTLLEAMVTSDWFRFPAPAP